MAYNPQILKNAFNNLLKKFSKESNGQSTVEFAIVVAAMLTIVIAIAAMWKLGDRGMLIDHTLSSASHHLKDACAGIVGDVFCC